MSKRRPWLITQLSFTEETLEYYRRLTPETEIAYRRICILQQQNLTPDKSSELKKLKRELPAFISADYKMGKNLPYWCESAQPSKTYVLHDEIGL